MVWLIIGIVFAVILLILTLIMLLPVELRLCYTAQSGLDLTAQVLWWRRPLNRAKKKSSSASKPKPAKKPPQEKPSVGATAGQTAAMLKAALKPLGGLIRQVEIRRLQVTAVCAGDDPAAAAMDYGVACAAVYPMVGWLKGAAKAPENAIDVRLYCDFNRAASAFEADILLRLRVFYAAVAAVRFGWRYWKQKRGEDTHHAEEKASKPSGSGAG